MNRQETRCTGTKDGKRCSKLISKESSFCSDCESSNTDNVTAQSLCESDIQSTGENDSSESHGDDNGNEKWDFHEQLNTSEASGVSTNVEKRCKNCGHIIHQDQMFCDKCGNKLGVVCLGEIHGKQCSKFISVESKFCAHCGTANLEKNSEKKRAPLKKSCNNCGNVIHKHQKFCNNCGYKIGAPCIGKIKGSPCSAFLNVEINFCENCGMENPDYIAVHHKVNVQCGGSENVLPPNESVITLTSMGFTREQAIDALKKTENNVEEAIHRILGIPIYDNRRTRRKFNISTIIKNAVLKKSCKSCGYDTEINQKFCNNCGYKIGSQCLGKIKGDPCTKFLSSETKWCSNCGTANPDTSTAQCQPQFVVENKKESVMKSVSLTYPREQANEASTRTEEHEKKAADMLHTDDDTYNIVRTKPKEQTPRNELKMELTSLEVTNKLAIDAEMFVDGNEDDLENSLVSLPVDNDSMEGKKDVLIKVLEEIKDSDEEIIGEISISDVSSENSDETFEEIASKESIINDIQKLLKNEGVVATRKYLTEQMTKWKRAKIKIAVAGQSAAGKSAFINAIRGVIFSDEGYAKEGFGDTTLNIEEYVHPKNKQIMYCDLPGYGTTTITREKFLEIVKISDYDMFLIFFTTVPTTDDEWLVTQLRKVNMPFCFVRTKLDQDIESGKRMGQSEKTVLNVIMETIARATKSMPALQDEQKFIISNNKPYIGDMSRLVQFMQERVPKIKCEAIMISIPAFTTDIIENKYQALLKRIPLTAVILSSMLLTDIAYPVINISPTIRIEIRMYFRVFELDSNFAKCVPGLKHYFDKKHFIKLMDDLWKQMPSLGVRLIPIYSTVQIYKVYKMFLTNLLNEIKIDAQTMYLHITKNV